MYEYTGIVTNVVDGDTLDLKLNLGFNITYKVRVRLKGIDTPEIFRPKTPMEKEQGKKARDFVIDRLLGKEVTLITFKDKTGKYGRYLADIVYTGKDMEAFFIVEELKKAGFEKKRFDISL